MTIPPPPRLFDVRHYAPDAYLHQVSKALIPIPSDPRLCPICTSSRINPAASSSGFVFCYRCIADKVDEKPSCPVTGLPCAPSQIRRIVES